MSGYSATWAGGVGGGIAGYLLCRAVFVPQAFRMEGDHDLATLALAILGPIAFGSGAGAWAVLRLKRFPRAGATSVLFPVLALSMIVGLTFVVLSLLPLIEGTTAWFWFFVVVLLSTVLSAVSSRQLTSGG